jgi:hypothetical protein
MPILTAALVATGGRLVAENVGEEVPLVAKGKPVPLPLMLAAVPAVTNGAVTNGAVTLGVQYGQEVTVA